MAAETSVATKKEMLESLREAVEGHQLPKEILPESINQMHPLMQNCDDPDIAVRKPPPAPGTPSAQRRFRVITSTAVRGL